MLDNAYVLPANKKAETSIIPHLRKNSEMFLIRKATRTIITETITLVPNADKRAVLGIITAKTAYMAPIADERIILIVLRANPDMALVSFSIRQLANKFQRIIYRVYNHLASPSCSYTFQLNLMGISLSL